jgi:drug/metabolite transporter (DMT)-like permease
MMTSREKLGIALGLVGMLSFAGTLPATRLAVTAFDPFFLSASRAVIAGCAGVVALVIARRSVPSRPLLLELMFTGVFTIIGFPVLMALAMTTVPASHGGVVLGILPLSTAVAAAFLADERPSFGFWLASVAGCAIVLTFVFWRDSNSTIEMGDLYLLGVVVVGAFAYTLSGRLSGRMPGWEVISWQVTMYLPLSVPVILWLWPDDLMQASGAAWAGLAYVSLVSQYLAFFTFNAAMALIGVARVGQIMLLQPFMIVGLSVPVNGERFEPGTLLFTAAVVATVIAGQRMRVTRS